MIKISVSRVSPVIIQRDAAFCFKPPRSRRTPRSFFTLLRARRYVILISVELDPELEDVLRQLFEACDEFQITPRLIGGLAVRGHTRRKRYTHDIDLSIDREDKPNLIAILKSMGFEYRDQTSFGGVKAWQQIGKVSGSAYLG